jgi:hypothetical protein
MKVKKLPLNENLNKLHSPVCAVLDHLKGVKSSFVLNYYPTLEIAVNEVIAEYSIQELKDFMYENGHEWLINDKLEEIFQSLETV